MKKILALTVISALALILVQCSDRGLPVDSEQPAGLYYSFGFRSDALTDNVIGDFPVREVLVYAPPGYDTHDYRTRYPVLYLLHGYGGDNNYYRGLYGLAETMDDMINSGEIEPMIVVTPNATSNLGGGFYSNSPDTLVGYPGQSFAGLYLDFIANEVVDSIDANYKTIPLRKFRGVGGHSMGGYGAIKLAILRNDLFGSTSSMSGPLAFNAHFGDVPNYIGMLSLLPGLFAENNFAPGDTVAYYAIRPGSRKLLTNMFFAMAAAFSPHDPANPDTSVAHIVIPGRTFKVDLPFTAGTDTGGVAIDSTVWALWLANDVSTMFLSGYGGEFDSTDLYVDAGDHDDLYFNLQARYFIGLAAQFQYIDEEYGEVYSGRGDNLQADHTTLIADRLRHVLMFHDRSFQFNF